MSLNVKRYAAAYITIALVSFGLGAWVDMPVLAQQPVCPAVVTVCGGSGGGGITAAATAITGGTDTRVIFNDGGVWGEDAGFTYAKATDTATLGALVLSDGSAVAPTLRGSVATTGINFSGSQINFGFGGGTKLSITSSISAVGADISPSATGNSQTLGLTGTRWAQLWLDATLTAAGTTGARTIDKNMGQVNFAAAATTLVVTNSRVTTTSFVFLTPQTADTTCKSFAVTRASGSFTITANAACTAETAVAFLVMPN